MCFVWITLRLTTCVFCASPCCLPHVVCVFSPYHMYVDSIGRHPHVRVVSLPSEHRWLFLCPFANRYGYEHARIKFGVIIKRFTRSNRDRKFFFQNTINKPNYDSKYDSVKSYVCFNMSLMMWACTRVNIFWALDFRLHSSYAFMHLYLHHFMFIYSLYMVSLVFSSLYACLHFNAPYACLHLS